MFEIGNNIDVRRYYDVIMNVTSYHSHFMNHRTSTGTRHFDPRETEPERKGGTCSPSIKCGAYEWKTIAVAGTRQKKRKRTIVKLIGLNNNK
jgi:hypothetical protein